MSPSYINIFPLLVLLFTNRVTAQLTQDEITAVSTISIFGGVGLLFVFLVSGFLIRFDSRKEALVKELEVRFRSMSDKEKEKIYKLEEIVEETCDTRTHGTKMGQNAWEEWMKQYQEGFERVLDKRPFSMGFWHYMFVSNYLKSANWAMKEEERVRGKLAKKIEEANKARHKAALMWGIYWPEQIEKHKLKWAEKQGLPRYQIEAQVSV
jgi:hypothetical protein